MANKTLSHRPVGARPNGVLALAWGKSSHQGPRSENQDAVVVVHPKDPQIARKGVLMVVCDGVGGAQGGRRASEIASTTAFAAYYDDPGTDPRAAIDAAIRKANGAVKDEAARNPAIASMATTIVMTAVIGNTLYVGHVGDSRAYIFRADGKIERITRDHSWVSEQMERGVLTEQQAKENPMRSVITRSLGAAANNTPDHRQFNLGPGDEILVCTDGLHGAVPDDQMRTILRRSPTPQKAAEELVSTGLANKTTDNTTAAVLLAMAGSQPARFPLGVVAGAGVLALGAGVALVLLGVASGGDNQSSGPLSATPRLTQALTARVTGGTGGVLIGGGDATATPNTPRDVSGPTATLAPTSTPVPTRPPATPTPTASPTPTPAPATPTPHSDQGGGQPPPTNPPPPPTAPPGPTQAPTQTPTSAATPAPTLAATPTPTQAPTSAPTAAPTQAPTAAPTQAPTSAPTQPPPSATP